MTIFTVLPFACVRRYLMICRIQFVLELVTRNTDVTCNKVFKHQTPAITKRDYSIVITNTSTCICRSEVQTSVAMSQWLSQLHRKPDAIGASARADMTRTSLAEGAAIT